MHREKFYLQSLKRNENDQKNLVYILKIGEKNFLDWLEKFKFSEQFCSVSFYHKCSNREEYQFQKEKLNEKLVIFNSRPFQTKQ